MFNKLRGLGGLVGPKVDHPLGDPRELRRIVDEIPGDNAFKALDEVVGWLESLQDARDFPEDRLYDAISRLDDVAQPHIKRLTWDYLHAPRASHTEERRLWTICHGFWTVLAAGYERCLAAAGQKGRAGEQIRVLLPALTARLIAALGAVLKWERFRYGPSLGVLWQRLGSALMFAENAGVATRSIQLHANVSGVSSAQQEFVKLVALHAASVDSLLPLEIELAERLIAHFLPGFVFSALTEHDSVYWVDLEIAQPPLRMARMPAQSTPSQRFFKPGSAHAGIAALLDDLERGHDLPGDINLGGQYFAKGLLPVLRHLAAYLAPVPPQRRHDRHGVKQRAIVLNGLASAYMAFSGQSRGLADGAATENWVVEDVSHGGFGAVLNILPGDEWLKIGALVAMQLEGGDNWVLGVVRRYHRSNKSEAHVGVETLARQATPAELKPRAASSYAALPGIRTLLIRDGNAPGEVRAVMLFASFDLRATLEWNDGDKRIQLSPVALVEQGDDYEVARYRLGTIA
ncbi:MAG: hypothetical protein WCA83_02095 [Azonexus sp.]